MQYRISLSGILAPGLLVDDRVPVGRVPALGLGSSLVSHASKYSRKNDLVSCSYYSSSRLSSLPCVARKWLSLFREAFTLKTELDPVPSMSIQSESCCMNAL